MMEEQETKVPDESGMEHFWEKPENILRLIDLIFFCDDCNNLPPS